MKQINLCSYCGEGREYFDSDNSRKNIKDFKSCELLPLLEPLDLPEGAETPIWLKIPFPPLHTVIIGPVNHLEDNLMKFCDYEGYDCVWKNIPRENRAENPVRIYENICSLNKSDYHGQKMEGNQCQDFIKEKNLVKLENLLLEDGMPEDLVKKYIVAFTSIREVYSSCCRKKLDPNHRSVTNKFKMPGWLWWRTLGSN